MNKDLHNPTAIMKFILLLSILIAQGAYSQTGITFKVASKLPDSITEKAQKTIVLNVQNGSSDFIELINIPIIHVDFEVLKKVGNNYILDSNCIFMPMPGYPGDNFKGIKIEKGTDLDIPMSFPPLCNLLENSATYKVRYFFSYTFRNKFYTVETDWHEYTCVFSPD